MALVPYNGMVQGGPDWFGPSAPLAPLAPPAVAGRTFDFQANYNLNVTKRPFTAVSWAMLQALADSHDLLRTVIETRKDQMAKQSPTVVPRDKKADPEDPAIAAQIAAAQKLLEEPYPGIEWEDWLRRILEDLFVIDAPCAYVRKTLGGELFGIKPLSGDTINRVLDQWGDTPAPPNAAYVQILKGVGAIHYTTDQLIYRPRNPRNNRAFGFSPVEQIITIVNIAIRRETWQLNYFTEGNLPDALIGTPMEWTPDQLRNFQDWFDSRLAGNGARRRGATFVPGDVAKGYVATKDTELFGKAEEWMARVICFAFSISPQPFVQQMNRATAGTAQEAAAEEGLEPIKLWVSRFWNYVFRTHCGWDKIRLGWEEEMDLDPKAAAEVEDILVKGGLKKRNEARKTLNLDPDPSPEADMLMVTTATGLIPVSLDAQIEQQTAKQDAMPDPPPVAGAPGAGGQSGGGGKAPPPKGPAGNGKGGGGAPKPKTGGPAKAAGVGGGAPPLVKAAIGLDRAVVRRSRKAMARAMGDAFKATADDVAGQVSLKLRHADKARKIDEKDGSGSAGVVHPPVDVDALVAGLDLSGLDVMVDAVSDSLFDVASDSAQKALAQVGGRQASELVDQVNQSAVDFSRDRAAELVGKRWTHDGELVDSHRPGMAISETTRSDLRSLIAKGLEDNIGTPAIAESIQESFAFSQARADLIAFTEVANANGQGKLEGWREGASAAEVQLEKLWQTTNNENECQECSENEAQGPVGLDDDFQSGDDAEPAHPNCQCVTYVQVVENSGGPEADDDA